MADKTPTLDTAQPEPARRMPFEGVQIVVDALHEILLNKLCALRGRTELRHLEDVKALLEAGGDLERPLRDAPRKDAGFSPLVLASFLRDSPLSEIVPSSGLTPPEVEDLERFRRELAAKLLAASRPEGQPPRTP